MTAAIVSASMPSNSPHSRVLWRAWKEVAKAERDMLDDITFADMVEKARASGESMYYI